MESQPEKKLANLPKWLNIGLAFPIIILNGWLLIQFINYFQPLVSIISIAILLAFVLDYPIKLLQKRGVPRILAVVVVLLLSIIILGAIGVILLPLILEQLNELANLLPYWIESGTQQIEALQNWASTQKLPVNLSGLAAESSNRFFAGQAQTAAGFNETQRHIDSFSASTNLGLCQGFSSVKEAICNSTGLINTNIANTYNNLTSQLTALGSAQAAMECRLSNQNERTQGLIVNSTDKILCAIETSNKNTRILQLEERLAEERSHHHGSSLSNLNININNLQNQVQALLASGGNRPGNS